MHESKVFVSMVLILIFAEVLGLYGWAFCVSSPQSVLTKSLSTRLIVALIMNSKVDNTGC